MSSLIKFIDNNTESGDWCVVVLNGEVIHEGHGYPQGHWFVEFFKAYQGGTQRFPEPCITRGGVFHNRCTRHQCFNNYSAAIAEKVRWPDKAAEH